MKKVLISLFSISLLISCSSVRIKKENSKRVLDYLNRVNLEITDNNLKNLSDKRILKTGFITVIDYNGKIIAHPDKKLINYDASKFDIINKILKNPQATGIIEYTFLDRDKIVFFKKNLKLKRIIIISIEKDDLGNEILTLHYNNRQ